MLAKSELELNSGNRMHHCRTIFVAYKPSLHFLPQRLWVIWAETMDWLPSLERLIMSLYRPKCAE